MEEAITAATLNSAHSLGRGPSHGAITVGRKGDFVVLDSSVSSWKHIIYRWTFIPQTRVNSAVPYLVLEIKKAALFGCFCLKIS